jgi:hypothetical protein
VRVMGHLYCHFSDSKVWWGFGKFSGNEREWGYELICLFEEKFIKWVLFI